MSKYNVAFNLVQALAAVLLGNVAYFLLSSSLPPPARHTAFKLDLGVLVDIRFCVVALGLSPTAIWWRHRRR